MDEALRRAGWICITAALAAYGTFAATSMLLYPAKEARKPTVIRDLVKKGEHHISGTINVPETCDALSLAVRQQKNNTYVLEFETWPDPAVQCTAEESSRSFQTVVFAPSVGVRFTATMDKAPIPIAVYPTLGIQQYEHTDN